MKNLVKRSLSTILVLFTLLISIIPFSAATNYDKDTDISFTLNCDKDGYTFNVYKVGTMVNSENPYKFGYTADVTSLQSVINSGNMEDLLSACDNLTSTLPSPIDSFTTDSTHHSKTFTGSDYVHGIYYVKAVNYPAGVKSVTNSVFALPYYDKATDSYIYTLSNISLAEKVIDDVPEIKKEITNSTKDNKNFTDVSLGDTVKFEISSSVAGSNTFKLTNYTITDTMAAGLTLTDNSVKVKVVNDKNETVLTLKDSDFTLTKGENGVFFVALNASVLENSTFYTGETVVVDYDAVLNENASTAITGNKNEAKLTYTNKNNVTSEVESNKVFVYTYKIEVLKTDVDGNNLENAEFALYKTKEDAEKGTNTVAIGTSDKDGLVKLLSDNSEMLLSSGTYYVAETKAPEGYNRITTVATVKIDVTYGTELVNGTYVSEAPADGVKKISFVNTKLLLPQTGGSGIIFIYVMAATILLVPIILLVARKKSKTEKVNK